MQNILILGAGKIGSLIAFLLANSQSYQVYLGDQSIEKRPDLDQIKASVSSLEIVHLNAKDDAIMENFLQKKSIQAIVSALPYYHNIAVARIAKKFNLSYFDLTEDAKTSKAIMELAQDATTAAFIPQCGLAPGFISIIANHLMQHFSVLDTVKMRVGALPANTSNSLQYALTWSTDGLINEYGNLCHAVEDGKEVDLLPLEGLEEIQIDGLRYEAFNTSGGIGTLAKTYLGKIKNLNYKTIRYPGHCQKIRFLMHELKLNHDRHILKHILENAIPKTLQDEVIVYVSVTGLQDDKLIEKNYVRKFYPQILNNMTWTAIQLTTASGICSAIDIALNNPEKYHGFVRQEQFSWESLINNRFGRYYAETKSLYGSSSHESLNLTAST